MVLRVLGRHPVGDVVLGDAGAASGRVAHRPLPTRGATIHDLRSGVHTLSTGLSTRLDRYPLTAPVRGPSVAPQKGPTGPRRQQGKAGVEELRGPFSLLRVHSPRNCGGRFSLAAAMPSWRSAVANVMGWASASHCRADSKSA